MTEATRIILMRHGETGWNQNERFRGRVDIPLDEVGVKQAAAAAAALRGQYPLTAIYSSPLARARQTADIVAAEYGLRVTDLPDLTDLDFGDWEGLAVQEVAERYPDLFRLWREEPQRLHIPRGETLDEARTRGVTSLRDIVARHPGQTVAIVTHRVLCKLLLCAVLGLDNSRFWVIDQATTAINVFDIVGVPKASNPDAGSSGVSDIDGWRFVIRAINEACHLRHLD